MTLATPFAIHPNAQASSTDQRAAALAELKFGVQFTDHMARVSWNNDSGWHDHRIEAYAPLQLDPAAAVFHYAQEVFEGLKAYRHQDGSIWAFRPELNARRFAASSARLALPQLPEVDFLESISSLVRIDSDWVPEAPGSLYLRPFMFASESFLGVRAAREVEYLVIASPVGSYFSGGLTPLSIWVAQDYHRAGPGGTGAAKCGGNYAASLLPQQQGYEQGCDQVCFLDAATNTFIEELGGMNTFFVTGDGRVLTPALTGTILEGVTRGTILDLVRDRGWTVEEGHLALSDIIDQIEAGQITEVFACGTAAVITPIGQFKAEEFDVTVGDGSAGPITQELYSAITDVQYGLRPDDQGWLHRVA